MASSMIVTVEDVKCNPLHIRTKSQRGFFHQIDLFDWMRPFWNKQHQKPVSRLHQSITEVCRYLLLACIPQSESCGGLPSILARLTDCSRVGIKFANSQRVAPGIARR
jgi:hypothetical protein